MDLNTAIEIINNISKHVVYDKNLKQICYSAQLVKALELIRKKAREGKISE